MDKIELGESSCRKKTNNDKMSEGERPLKKAKYPWQIKGKCHLKDQENDIENKPEVMETPPDDTKENNDETSAPEGPSTANNLEILGDYLLKKDFNIPPGDSSDSDGTFNKSDMEEDEGDVIDLFHGFSDATAKEVEGSPVQNFNTSGSSVSCSSSSGIANENHPSLVDEKNSYSLEDTYIARWQARQIAKGFVDNTINRVLDSWLVAPLPQTYDDTHNLALDVAEFFDNLPANNTVENEGILMAISAHGLQNNQSGSRSSNESRGQQCRNYGTRMTIAISECVSRNGQESGERNSNENLNNASQSECLSEGDNKDNEDSSNICQPISTSSTSCSTSSARLDHRKSHSENELCSALVDANRSSNTNTNILSDTTWRPIPQPCSCSHAARRVNVTQNIPFHKRDNLNYSNNTIDNCLSSPPSSQDVPEYQTINQVINNIAEEIVAPVPVTPSPEPLHTVNDDQEFDDHFNFMDAAVSFAIQNKGLTSFSSVDYG